MKNANRLLKLTLVITAVLFMYWLNPYLLIKDKERYLWNSVGYESYKFFSFFRVDLARYLNAEGTYRDDSGNSALYIAVYFNNKTSQYDLAYICDSSWAYLYQFSFIHERALRWFTHHVVAVLLVIGGELF